MQFTFNVIFYLFALFLCAHNLMIFDKRNGAKATHTKEEENMKREKKICTQHKIKFSEWII